MGVQHPKARRAVVKALGTYKGMEAAHALQGFLDSISHSSSESYFVEAEAIRAFALSSLNLGQTQLDQVEKFLLQQLEKASYREIIRATTLRTLGELPGVGRGERAQALGAIIDWSGRGREMDARYAAIETLGKVVRTATPAEQGRIFKVFSELSDEEGFRVRMALIQALRDSESAEGIGLLGKIHHLELDGRARRKALVVMDELKTAGGASESVLNLKASLEKLEEEYRRLRTLVEGRTS
jgi:aminopeptidase N